MSRTWSHFLLAWIYVAATVIGCERPHSDMGQQDKYSTYDSSAYFPDGKSARPLPPGVVPRPEYGGSLYLRDEQETPYANQQVVPLATPIPFSVTPEVLHRGGEQFNIFCAVCHGRLGNGEGMIVQRGLTRPPSFHVQRLKDAPDAHFYNVISNGFGAMFSYNDRISPQRRWEIVSYIRALQMAPDLDGIHLSEADRAVLIAGGDRKTPTTGGGG